MTEPIIVEGHRALMVRFPLKGEWIAVNTPGARIPSHGTNFFAQRYAYDFNMTDVNANPFASSHIFKYVCGRLPVMECYSWAQPVLAPVSGLVFEARDGWPDRMKINFLKDYIKAHLTSPRVRSRDFRPLTGNYVILRENTNFLLLAHLHCGSLKVQTGQSVVAGDMIGEVGNSGSSMAPHLHIQAMDCGDPRTANGIPCSFKGLEYLDGTVWRPLVSGIPGRLQRIRACTSPH